MQPVSLRCERWRGKERRRETREHEEAETGQCRAMSAWRRELPSSSVSLTLILGTSSSPTQHRPLSASPWYDVKSTRAACSMLTEGVVSHFDHEPVYQRKMRCQSTRDGSDEGERRAHGVLYIPPPLFYTLYKAPLTWPSSAAWPACAGAYVAVAGGAE